MDEQYYNEVLDVSRNLKQITDSSMEHLKEFCEYEKNAFREDTRKEAFILGMHNLMQYIIELRNGRIIQEFEEIRRKENG